MYLLSFLHDPDSYAVANEFEFEFEFGDGLTDEHRQHLAYIAM